MDFDESRLYYSHQQLQIQRPNDNDQQQQHQQQPQGPLPDDDQVDWSAVRRHFREFLRNYRQGAHGYLYRDRLLRMHRRVFGAERVADDPTHTTNATAAANMNSTNTTSNMESFHPSTGQHAVIDMDLAHVGEYDTALLGLLLHQPAHVLPLVELAARDALRTLLYDTHPTSLQQQQASQTNTMDEDDGEGQQHQNDDDQGHDGEHATTNNNNNNNNNATSTAVDDMMAAVGGIQILLKGNMALTPLRSIKSEHMHRLLKCPGIVISTSPIKSRAVQMVVRCSRCLNTQTLSPAADAGPFSALSLPSRCAGPDPATCGMFPYGVVPDESQFWDRQTLKLQEAPETVPTGEMPRSVLLAVERALIDQAPPGTRVTVLCIPTLFTTNTGGGGNASKKSAAAAIKSVYLRVVGMTKDDNAHDRDLFTPAEEEAFVALSRRSDVYDILSRSVAPSISGSYTVDIKKALICLLLGGSRKRLPDGVRLRGDINVLLLGDPSTAKSQFLKFISRVAPIGIYTSGKGSSAAGLTASVVRDARGEFYLEGGAMVLADGGVVCIDEFDKMRPADRVAIHEAMEQQTISVAKAGITTVLNSRSSVLAAANPVFGRYDDFKSASENIDLMTTILSRFDLIFLVRDVRDEERDRLICRHVMGVHIQSNNSSSNSNNGMRHHGLTNSSNWRGQGAAAMVGGNGADGEAALEANNMGDANMGMDGSGAATSDAIAENIMRVASTGAGELSVPAMKKYIQYAKAKCAPRLSEEAGQVLASAYVKIRDDVRRQSASLQKQGGRGEASDQAAIPITVRQLEALIRVSESLAKMRLDGEVRAEDVAEALRLFRVSTMTANAADSNRSQQATSTSALAPLRNSTNTSNTTTLGAANASMDELDRTENFVRSRLNLGGSLLNKQKLLEEAAGQGYDAMVVARVLGIMVMRGQVQERNQGRLVKRIK